MENGGEKSKSLEEEPILYYDKYVMLSERCLTKKKGFGLE